MPTAVRMWQGFGAVPIGVKDFAFRSFVLLYYNQVLGLSAATAGIILFVALVIDAFTDPWVGHLSDQFRHRLGRRHPFMLASLLPFSLAIYALFAPPAWVMAHLAIWMLLCTVLVRLAFTFFAVPWHAMFAELTDDYLERSALVAWRFAVGWLFGILFFYASYAWLFAASPEFEQGQLNPNNYPDFALLLALTVFAGGAITTFFTLNQVPYLHHPVESDTAADSFWNNLLQAKDNRDFLILFFAVLASSVVIGTNQALEIYVNTYFWGFGGEELRFMAMTAFGGLFAFLTVGLVQKRIDKKYLLVGGSVLIMLTTATPVTLKLFGLLPENGSTSLLVILVSVATCNAYLATIALIMFGSMVADTLDLQELRTGKRQEGLFNAAIAFSGKATTGVGILIAGLLLQYVVGIPQGNSGGGPAAVSQAVVTAEMGWRIAILDAYVVPAFNLVWLYLAMQYSISRDTHAQIREKLQQMRYGHERLGENQKTSGEVEYGV